MHTRCSRHQHRVLLLRRPCGGGGGGAAAAAIHDDAARARSALSRPPHGGARWHSTHHGHRPSAGSVPFSTLPSTCYDYTTPQRCPTAAVLVEASGSLRVTLPHCVTAVQAAVRAELRAVLTRHLVAPLLQAASAEASLVTDAVKAGQPGADRDAAAVHAAAAVHCATTSASNLRYVAFSHAQPSLRHPSWDGMWAATTATAGAAAAAPARPTSSVSDAAARHNRLPIDDASTIYLDDVTCDAVALQNARAVMQPHVVELTPLLGCQTDGGVASFTAVCMNARTDLSAPSRRPSVTFWERHRVDVFVPPLVQVQAAVRHLLRRRRPPTDFVTREADAGAQGMHGEAEVRRLGVDRCAPAPRPLALLAVVAPEHHTAAYVAFMETLEQERSAALEREPPVHDALLRHSAAMGGPVQLMLFDSRGLVRVSAAV